MLSTINLPAKWAGIVDSSYKVAVVVASTGRPTELGQLLDRLDRQTYQPEKIVLSVVGAVDLPVSVPPRILVVSGAKGSSAQRNRGMEPVLSCSDIIVFLDDDYLPSDRALEGIVRLFSSQPDVVGANGELLADGIHSAGIDYDSAIAMIEDHDAADDKPGDRELADTNGLYGCNMAFRASAIGPIRFDEALPLYGWQEDIDFAAQLLPRGRLVKTTAFYGVHRGVKGARTSGLRFGYSQVVNPIYLSRKGTMRAGYALKIVTKNVLANHLRLLNPEPWVDRVGRVRGNWLAFRDVLVGKGHPCRILNVG
jgi:GT2 family glycosyltransferase